MVCFCILLQWIATEFIFSCDEISQCFKTQPSYVNNLIQLSDFVKNILIKFQNWIFFHFRGQLYLLSEISFFPYTI